MRTLSALAALVLSCSRPELPQGPAPLSDAERSYLLTVARKALVRYFHDGSRLRPADVPSSLSRFSRRIVFLTFHVDGDTRGCNSASEPDVGASTALASVRTAQDDRYLVPGVKGPDGKPVTLRPEELDRVRLEVNLLRPYERLEYRDHDSLRGEVEPGIHGVRLAKGQKGAFYLPYVAIEFEYDIAPYLRTLTYKAKLKRGEWKKGAALWRFETENFIEDRPGGRALPLYRWNVLAGEAGPADLESAARRAWAFLQQLRAGKTLRQGYHPKKKELLAEAPAWAAARAAAAVYRSGEASLLPFADEILPPQSAAVTVGDHAHRALALLGRGKQAEARAHGKALSGALRDGRFATDARSRGLAWDREHEEVLAAVRALAALAPTDRALAASARAALEAAARDFGERVGALADLVTAALAVHALDRGAGWLARAKAWGERLRLHQYVPGRAPWRDYEGGFNLDRVPAARDAARAARALGLLAAAGEGPFAEPARLAAHFVLSLQYREENAFAYPHIVRYFGGVRPDLHRVSAELEATLDALEAWESLRR
jgi:AMMECR1 domain-containing protein